MNGCSITLSGQNSPSQGDVLTQDAINFIADLHRTFNPTRKELLAARVKRQEELNAGTFVPQSIKSPASRDTSWVVAKTPPDLDRRWVEITGPTDKKMVINALNSGADTFMADFEDANSPTWKNMIEGQQNLIEAIRGTLSFKTAEGKEYTLNKQRAVLIVRPRGWHLDEAHMQIDGQPIAASLFDFGLYLFHNAKELTSRGSAPYFYLPKLENHLEARLWNDIFVYSQQKLGIPQGTIRATVLLETILAAFEMEEILYELREHSSGLNAGRWDYIFSAIKKFQAYQPFIFPDRSAIVMTVPFMKAYTERLVHICHKHGAHAIGGMAAFIPSRKDANLNAKAMEKVREDKLREVAQGFDGTWVAHPDLVPVARTIFSDTLKGQANQKHILPPLPPTSLLTDFSIKEGGITEEGIRKNISIALQYIQAWLHGHGAVGLYNLMEDAATAEISRSQLWQWVHHPDARISGSKNITAELYLTYADEEQTSLVGQHLDDPAMQKRLLIARTLLDHCVLQKKFTDFITIPAYQELIKLEGH